jgi:hypothetical protein
MEVRRASRVVLAALVAALVTAPDAIAGTYDVNACATPAGKFTNHSWTIAVTGSFAAADCKATDARPQLAVTATADQLYDAGQAATLTFAAPAKATIANFRLHRQLFQFNPLDGSPVMSVEVV